jgi:phytoene synthase
MPTDPTAYCLEQVRRFDRERYLCTLFAPAGLRDHLWALYAFNVEIARVREIVSEPVIGQMRLQWWRDAIAEFNGGRSVRAHPVAQALAQAMQARPIQPAHLERLLVAREFDLADTPPADLAALEDYACGTSSTLLLAALDVLGVGDDVSAEAARQVGIAWALVGLLRAVPFHARQRRLYLPLDLLAQAGIDAEAVFEGQAGKALAEIAAQITARTREHLGHARDRRRDVAHAALPIMLFAVLAERHCRRLERQRFQLFAAPAPRPAAGDMLRLALAAWRGAY